ncbi:MAG: redoxin domain-containing protein [Candidatus Omnitrophota bacterium]|jgi:peroxiredoxin
MRNCLKSFISVFLVLTFVFGVCLAGKAAAQGVAVKKRLPAPDFKLQDTYQDIVALKDYKGEQPVLLFFWTTWCPFCERELSVLNNAYQNLVKDGIELLAINAGELPDTVTNFIQDFNLAYRVLLDRDTGISSAYGVVGVPTYVLVDKAGNIVFKDNYFPQREYKALLAK